jgi:hypothetical protein
VKVLDWGQEGQETKHREAFEKEVAVWQKLDHPNVTKVLYDCTLHHYLVNLKHSVKTIANELR